MYLNKLLLKKIGKFNNKEFNLEPGLNIIHSASSQDNKTIREFIVGMLYGTTSAEVIGTGKAYIKLGDKKYFIERSFLRKAPSASMLDVGTGREERLKKKGSLYGTILDIDRNTYTDAMCIDGMDESSSKEISSKLNTYLRNMSLSGSSDVDQSSAIDILKEYRREFDLRSIQKQVDKADSDLEKFANLDRDLEDIRKEIADVGEEFAVETARRKREARKLVESDDKSPSYDEDEDIKDGLDELAKKSEALSNDTLLEDKEVKFTDKLWVILLTGVFVVGVIALIVYILPFEPAVRKLFIICTILFVVVTIVEGLYAKGYFDTEVRTPSEEEFRQIISELEKTETNKDVEIDMSFAKDYLNKKSELKDKEVTILNKISQRDELAMEQEALIDQRDEIKEEIEAINLAIETLEAISLEIKEEMNQLISDKTSKMVSIITGGKYVGVALDKKYRVLVKDDKSSTLLDKLSDEDARKVYLAIRMSIAQTLSKNSVPLIFSEVLKINDVDYAKNIIKCIDLIGSDQIIIITEDSSLKDTLKSIPVGFNYIEL